MKKVSTRTNEKTKESAKEKKLADKIGPVHRKESKMITSNHQDPNPKQLISRDSNNPNQ
jgi:hypothetical protein